MDASGSSFVVERAAGGELPLEFLQQITLTPAAGMREDVEAPLTFRGYCGLDAMKDSDSVIARSPMDREPGSRPRLRHDRVGA